MVEFICFALNPSVEEVNPSHRLKLYRSERPHAPTITEVLSNHLAKCITEIDVTNADIRTTDITETAKSILPYLLRDKFSRITVQDTSVSALKGNCRKAFRELFREIIGDAVEILGVTINPVDIIKSDKFINKIAGSSDAWIPEEIEAAVNVLNSISTFKNIPSALCDSMKRAYKSIKRSKRARRLKNLNNAASISPVVTQKRSATENKDFSKETKSAKRSHSDTDKTSPSSASVALAKEQTNYSTHVIETRELLLPSNPFTFNTTYTNGSRTKKCYIHFCKKSFHPSGHEQMTQAERQYSRLCPPCARFNFEKRKQRADLTGRIALVTGGRIKIGYQTALKLLRDGCTVVSTSRFPHDAARRYAQEADYDEWASRLHIYPLDLKNIAGIYKFTEFIKGNFPCLDIIINNAAQTIRRPAHFYKHLRDYECLPLHKLPPEQQAILMEAGYANTSTHLQSSTSRDASLLDSKESAHLQPPLSNRPNSSVLHSNNVSHQASNTGQKSLFGSNYDGPVPTKRAKLHSEPLGTNQSNLEIVPSTGHLIETTKIFFPEGEFDADGQQLDLRTHNSWLSTLEAVPLGEMMETLMVNTVAPFILNKELKSHLCKSPHLHKFIVNVSAMEGQFARVSKTKFHPHTNMAKAALNMMTRTAAIGYAELEIYMTSVDTGWITDERPAYMAEHERNVKGFTLPLDVIDGAARVYDPIVQGLTPGVEKPYFAVFLKDYKPTSW